MAYLWRSKEAAQCPMSVGSIQLCTHGCPQCPLPDGCTQTQHSVASAVQPKCTHPCPSQTAYSLSLIDLRRQVELHVAVVRPLKVILHKQRRIWPEAKLYGATQRRRFGKVHEVTERKRRGHGLMHCEGHLLLWLLGLPRLEHHVAGADITLHAECDALLACLHLHRLAELLQVPADLLELGRGQLRGHLVVMLGDLHVLTFNLHELQVEIGYAVLLTAFALEAHNIGIASPPQLQRVNVHPQGRGPIALELRKGGLPQEE